MRFKKKFFFFAFLVWFWSQKIDLAHYKKNIVSNTYAEINNLTFRRKKKRRKNVLNIVNFPHLLGKILHYHQQVNKFVNFDKFVEKDVWFFQLINKFAWLTELATFLSFEYRKINLRAHFLLLKFKQVKSLVNLLTHLSRYLLSACWYKCLFKFCVCTKIGLSMIKCSEKLLENAKRLCSKLGSTSHGPKVSIII